MLWKCMRIDWMAIGLHRLKSEREMKETRKLFISIAFYYRQKLICNKHFQAMESKVCRQIWTGVRVHLFRRNGKKRAVYITIVVRIEQQHKWRRFYYSLTVFNEVQRTRMLQIMRFSLVAAILHNGVSLEVCLHHLCIPCFQDNCIRFTMHLFR